MVNVSVSNKFQGISEICFDRDAFSIIQNHKGKFKMILLLGLLWSFMAWLFYGKGAMGVIPFLQCVHVNPATKP